MKTLEVNTLYVDNNATARVAIEVYEAMVPYFTEHYFNPSSMYEPARAVASAIGRERDAVARELGGIDPRQILFASCAT
jgi:cysteine desulfurase